MTAWRWLNSTLIYAIHDRQLAEHGGPDGIRDKGLVESALVRPQNLAAYESPDAADLAAAYAYGLARNHGFVDGNKRTAWIAARVFLADQGLLLAFEKVDAVSTMEKVAAGTLTEPELASWFRDRLRQGT
ncbi:MAG: type II toxin-antitoxin system death-on-curing family toxin [Burkholderiaceae bacterium]